MTFAILYFKSIRMFLQSAKFFIKEKFEFSRLQISHVTAHLKTVFLPMRKQRRRSASQTRSVPLFLLLR